MIFITAKRKEFLKAAGVLNNTELCEELGMTTTYLSLIFNGKRKLTMNLIIKMANQCNLKVSEFLKEYTELSE